MPRKVVSLVVALLGLGSLTLAGCGYALAGRGSFLPERIRVIGVPIFTNQTPYFDLEQVFTEKVRSELIGRGRYTILPESVGVDAVLTGLIRSLNLSPSSFTDDQQASRYVATITASLELRDVVNDEVLWENPSLRFREEFDAATGADANDPNAFFDQGTNALERLSTEFARTVVGTILEAF
jgi:hypothetical protein